MDAGFSDRPWAAMVEARSALAYDPQDGLCLDDVPLAGIAERFGTPAHVYGAGTIRGRIDALRQAFDAAGLAPALRYAVKANDHLAVLALMRNARLGADVTGAGELARARAAGMAAADMVFSGVGKRLDEIEAALAAGIGQINVESAEELDMIDAVARRLGTRAPVALRINPDVDAGTHDKIATGRAGDKFGIAFDAAAALYRHASTMAGITPVGLAVHIGSQIMTVAPYEAAYRRIAALIGDLRAEGLAVSRFDLGGGIGIPYDDGSVFPLPAYAAMLARVTRGLDVGTILEPGRYLVGPAGVLLARVTLVKRTAQRVFVVLDAGMNDLMRPALYGARHAIVPVAPADAAGATHGVDVVGPVCESSDVFATGMALPDLAPGAPVAILDAGAYGAVMGSRYNGRPAAPICLVDRGEARLIRPRESLEAMWRDEIVPTDMETSRRAG